MPLGASRLSFLAYQAIEEGRTAVTVTPVGNAQISTAQSKFGGASSAYDGTGDYLTATLPNAFGTNDFTIEGWVWTSNTDNHGMFHLSSTILPASTANSIAIAPRAGNNGWTVYLGSGTSFNTTIGCATNTWYHVAVVRSSGTSTVYIDGAVLRSQADTTDYSITALAIGGYYSTSFTLTGYIDEFRISDNARYTSTFTPPTSAFTNDANTIMLLHMDGTNGSTTFTDDNS